MTERDDHKPWCHALKLDLCGGCKVKKGWETSETCTGGKPHRWPWQTCICGPNDRRKRERRAPVDPPERVSEPSESDARRCSCPPWSPGVYSPTCPLDAHRAEYSRRLPQPRTDLTESRTGEEQVITDEEYNAIHGPGGTA